MAGGRSARGSRRHAAAASVVVPFPRDAAGARLDLARFVPSGRSLLADDRRARRGGRRVRRCDVHARLRRRTSRRQGCAAGAGARGHRRDPRPRRAESRHDRRRRRGGDVACASLGRRRLGRPRVPTHARGEGRARARGGCRAAGRLVLARDGCGQDDSAHRDRNGAAAPAALAREGHDASARREHPGRLVAGDASARRGALRRPCAPG